MGNKIHTAKGERKEHRKDSTASATWFAQNPAEKGGKAVRPRKAKRENCGNTEGYRRGPKKNQMHIQRGRHKVGYESETKEKREEYTWGHVILRHRTLSREVHKLGNITETEKTNQ